MEVKSPALGSSGRYRAGVLLNVITICGLGVAVAGAILAIVHRIQFTTDLRWDLTRDARFTLGPETDRLLRELSTPLTVTFVYGIDADVVNRAMDLSGQPRREIMDAYYRPLITEVAGRAQIVLTEWGKASPQVSFESFFAQDDPQRAADVARRLGRGGGDVVNRIVLQLGNRQREVLLRQLVDVRWGYFDPTRRVPDDLPQIEGRWRVQTELTEALRALIVGDAVKVGVVSGLDARFESSSPQFQAVRYLLEGQGYEIQPLDLGALDAIPAETRVLVIPALGRAPTSHDEGLLIRYEKAGGRFLIFTDPRLPVRHDTLLEPFGTKVLSELVDDPEVSSAASQSQGQSVIRSRTLCAGRHPIDSDLKDRVALYLGISGHLEIGPDCAPGAERVTLLRGSGSAHAIPLAYRPDGSAEPVPTARRTVPERPTFAAALRRPSEGGGPGSRIVLFAGSDILVADALNTPAVGNRDLILNSMAWLSDRAATIGSRPEQDRRDAFVDVETVRNPLLLWLVGVLPAVAILVAIATASARRA